MGVSARVGESGRVRRNVVEVVLGAVLGEDFVCADAHSETELPCFS
jgi:hypothetical protein